MSDITTDELRTLGMLKTAILSELGYRAKAENLGGLITEMLDVNDRFLYIPDNLMTVLKDIAASHGSGSLSRLFARPVKSLGSASHETDIEDDGSVFLSLEELRPRLLEIARSTGLKGIEDSSAEELLIRLRRLAKANTDTASQLEYVEYHLAEGEGVPVVEAEPEVAPESAPDVGVETEVTPASTSVIEVQPESVDMDDVESEGVFDVEDEARNAADLEAEPEADTKAEVDMPSSQPISLLVKNFGFSMYRLDWMEGDNAGMMDPGSSVFTLEPYGHVLVGKGRAINLGQPVDPGVSTFFLRDPLSGIAAAGKFPYVDDFGAAADRIIEATGRLQEDKRVVTKKQTRFTDLRKRLNSGMTPHDFEMERVMRDFERLGIPMSRLIGGAVFFSGRKGKGGADLPPAQVMQMLSAMRALGIRVSTMGMYYYPKHGSMPFVFEPEDGSVVSGSKRLLQLGAGKVDLTEDVLYHYSRFLSAMEELKVETWIMDRIRKYHIPLALGLWWKDWGEFGDRLYGLMDDVISADQNAANRILQRTYRLWQKRLTRGVGGKLDGNGGSPDGGGSGHVGSGNGSLAHDMSDSHGAGIARVRYDEQETCAVADGDQSTSAILGANIASGANVALAYGATMFMGSAIM